MSTDTEQIVLVTPGTRIAHTDEGVVAGNGTYTRSNRIYASVVGRVIRKKDEQSGKEVIEVLQEKEAPVVPVIGSVVTCKVRKITPKLASVSIMCVGSKALKEEFPGIIQVQDVRATEIDKVEIYKAFRPGDIVRAEVISLGDMRSYYLSTAKNELGVIFAQSVAGATMIPISWQEMQCPKTKMREFRKVAFVGANE